MRRRGLRPGYAATQRRPYSTRRWTPYAKPKYIAAIDRVLASTVPPPRWGERLREDRDRLAETDKFAVYRDGLKRMAEWLAIWRNGEQLVGVQEKPLKQVYAEIDEGKWD